MQYKVNPSWLAVKPLHNATFKIKTLDKSDDDGASVRKIHITTLCIPVTYDFVLDNVPGLQERPPVPPSTDDPAYIGTDLPPKGFDFILHVGVAGPGSISIETLAHKLGYEKPDASGRYAPIVQSGGKGKVSRGFAEGYDDLADELQTQIDVPQLVRHLKDAGVKVSAFKYTRNSLIFGPQSVQQSTDAGRYLCDFVFYCSLAAAEKSDTKSTPVLFLHCPPTGHPHSTEEVTDAITKVVTWVGSRLPL